MAPNDAAISSSVHQALDNTPLGPWTGIIIAVFFFARTALGVYGQSRRDRAQGLTFQGLWEKNSQARITAEIAWDRERTKFVTRISTLEARVATLEARLLKAGLDAS